MTSSGRVQRADWDVRNLTGCSSQPLLAGYVRTGRWTLIRRISQSGPGTLLRSPPKNGSLFEQQVLRSVHVTARAIATARTDLTVADQEALYNKVFFGPLEDTIGSMNIGELLDVPAM